MVVFFFGTVTENAIYLLSHLSTRSEQRKLSCRMNVKLFRSNKFASQELDQPPWWYGYQLVNVIHGWALAILTMIMKYNSIHV